MPSHENDPEDESHAGSRNMLMPDMPQMPQVPQMPLIIQLSQAQGTDLSAESLDHLHKSTLIELAAFSFQMCRFHEHAGVFANKISEVVHDLNQRLTIAEAERDELRAMVSQQQQHQQPQLDTTVTVPQTPTENGSQKMAVNDDEDDDKILFSTPATPSKLPIPNSSRFSLLSKDDEDPFISKLNSVKKAKSEKTKARKALQIKIPSGPIPTLASKSARSMKIAACCSFQNQSKVVQKLISA